MKAKNKISFHHRNRGEVIQALCCRHCESSQKTWQSSLDKRTRQRSQLSSRTPFSPAFTIVELLVVIVVIAVLAAITVVGYRGISKQTTESVMKGDLSNSFKALENFKTLNDTYPSTIDCSKSESSTNLCLQNNSKDITFTYVPSSDLKTYQLCTTSANLKENYCISNSNNMPSITADADLPTATVAESCPAGFILVPGSSTYGTSDFCVMKYEAKADDDGDGIGDTTYTIVYNTWPADQHPISSTVKLVSTKEGYPISSLSQATAIAAALNYTENCNSGCHLITEAEWMTIAQNVLNQPENWSGGMVGDGYIYSGHNDDSPDLALAASNDSDGYYGTGNTFGNQKRTLVLSNGEVIWDLAGNVYEWTAGQAMGGQPGVLGGGYAWREWTDLTTVGTLAQSPFPSNTNISGADSWNSNSGIGMIYTSADDTTNIYSFLRGGSFSGGTHSGILSFRTIASSPYSNVGFRVVAPAS